MGYTYVCGHPYIEGKRCPVCEPAPSPWTQAQLCALVGDALHHFGTVCPNCERPVNLPDYVSERDVEEFVAGALIGQEVARG